MIQYHACRCSLGRPGRDYRADGSRIELKQAITASLLVRNFRMAALNSPPPDHKRSWSGTPNSVLPRRKLISPTCRSAPRASNRSPRSSQCASSVVSTAASFSAVSLSPSKSAADRPRPAQWRGGRIVGHLGKHGGGLYQGHLPQARYFLARRSLLARGKAGPRRSARLRQEGQITSGSGFYALFWIGALDPAFLQG